MPLNEETFFTALPNDLQQYTLTVTYQYRSLSAPYAVEIFARGESYRCKGLTPSECFDNLLRALAITPRPAPLSDVGPPSRRP